MPAWPMLEKPLIMWNASGPVDVLWQAVSTGSQLAVVYVRNAGAKLTIVDFLNG